MCVCECQLLAIQLLTVRLIFFLHLKTAPPSFPALRPCGQPTLPLLPPPLVLIFLCLLSLSLFLFPPLFFYFPFSILAAPLFTPSLCASILLHCINSCRNSLNTNTLKWLHLFLTPVFTCAHMQHWQHCILSWHTRMRAHTHTRIRCPHESTHLPSAFM